jgi:hypothetical protein
MKKQLEEIVSKEEQVQVIVNKMTNWQRHQWAKAGRPQSTLEDVIRFKEMKRGSVR